MGSVGAKEFCCQKRRIITEMFDVVITGLVVIVVSLIAERGIKTQYNKLEKRGLECWLRF